MLESVSASHKQDPELTQTPREGPLLPNVFFPIGEAKCSKTYTAMQLREYWFRQDDHTSLHMAKLASKQKTDDSLFSPWSSIQDHKFS